MAEFASKGVAGTALGLGAGALGVELLKGGLGNLFGGTQQACAENQPVNRYEVALLQENAALKTEVQMHKAEIYVDNKLEALNERWEQKASEREARCDKRLRCIEDRLNDQAIYNERNTTALGCMGQQLAGLQSVINQITRTTINGDAVCPPYMPRYNSWTAPTNEASTGT